MGNFNSLVEVHSKVALSSRTQDNCHFSNANGHPSYSSEMLAISFNV